MKYTFSLMGLLLTVALSQPINAQNMNKKFKTVETSRDIPIPAETVWNLVAVDYGSIANSHPTIVSSAYVSGTLKGGKGAERKCYFDEKGKRMLHEKITEWNPEQMSFTQMIVDLKKFPLDNDNSKVTYSVEPVTDNSSRIKAVFHYRTKPAFMGGMVKGKFKSLLDSYFISVEHHLTTGENVTIENFKKIEKQYIK